MKPITYLCFTLLSIVIQFCLMDFINEQMAADTTVVDFNNTIVKNDNISHIFGRLKQKPQALYYHTEKSRFQIKNKSLLKYNNNTLTESELTSSTELAITVFDLLYDENVSVTDSDSTTETFFTSSEFDNVTEITFFDKKPSISTIKPTLIPKRISTNKCYCDLLYKACDINCCCDNDCSDSERTLLNNCKDNGEAKWCDAHDTDNLDMCSSQFACNEESQNNLFGYLFCIKKANLPEKQKRKRVGIYLLEPLVQDSELNDIFKPDSMSTDHWSYFTISNWVYGLDIDNRLKWHITMKKKKNMKFSKNLYKSGDPIWMVTNGTVDPLELPVTITNEYCNGYKAVEFLRNEHIKCYVRLKDLHILDAIKNFEWTKIASPNESTLNSTIMDCSALHCINWTLLVCDDNKCTEYDKRQHEPSCSDSYCNNIGTKIDYEFYSNVSLITRALMKFHIRKVPMTIEFITQEITVNFFIGNESMENIVRLSGNPGYIKGLPVIVSLSESNHTEDFYNSSAGKRKHLLLPYNKNGECVVTNLTRNILKFGHNQRLTCRAYFGQNFTMHNGTHGCMIIQMKIDVLYGVSSNIFISPFGNPQGVSDENWVYLQTFDKSNIYGEYHSKNSELLCYNLITRIAFVIAFADTNEANKRENKILSARVISTTKNITFSMEDLSAVITIDTMFIDVNKPIVHEYAGTPHLNFHLPKDFFFPLASSEGNFVKQTLLLYVCTCAVFYFFHTNKITLY